MVRKMDLHFPVESVLTRGPVSLPLPTCLVADAKGSVDIHGVMEWWFAALPVTNQNHCWLCLETRMYIHHSRHAGIASDLTPQQFPWVMAQLYSLCQQVLAQYPLLYVLNVCG
jgi:hypothetical protein